jgi:hypothetical protein
LGSGFLLECGKGFDFFQFICASRKSGSGTPKRLRTSYAHSLDGIGRM